MVVLGRLSLVVSLIVLLVPATFSGAEAAATRAFCRSIGQTWWIWPDGYTGCCRRGSRAEMRNERGHEHACVGEYRGSYKIGECRCAFPTARCIIGSGGQRECRLK